MPLLAGIVISMFSGLAGFLVDMLGRKVGIAAAYVATLSAIMVGMLAMLSAVVVPLANALFTAYPYTGWMGLVFPQPAFGICMSALGTVWAGTVLYAWQREALRIAASV